MHLSVIEIGSVLFGQLEQASGGAEGASLLEFVRMGGPMMIPIGLASLVALTVIIERFITLRRRNIISADFLPGLKKILGNGNGNTTEALDYCRADASPVANVIATGIKKLGAPLEVMERHIQESGEREALGLRKNLRVLAVTFLIAPLMGLLGTIFGMIEAFQTVATSSEALGKAELLAGGIYKAMITTAAGLMLAIPVLVTYHFLLAKIEGLVVEIDRTAVDFIEEYAEAQNKDQLPTPKLRAANDDDEGDLAVGTA